MWLQIAHLKHIMLFVQDIVRGDKALAFILTLLETQLQAAGTSVVEPLVCRVLKRTACRLLDHTAVACL